MAETLTSKSCTPCRGGIPPLTPAEVEEQHRHTPAWGIRDGSHRIARTFQFKNFAEAFVFVQRVADLAEAEGTTRISALAGATRPCRCRPRRSKACTRMTSSWPPSSTRWPAHPGAPQRRERG